MLPFEDRYSRQRRLHEIGPAGQQAIERARLAVAHYAGGQTELNYLRRAGAGVHWQAEKEPREFAHAKAFQHEAARDFAWGAWSALCQLRHIVQGGSGTL